MAERPICFTGPEVRAALAGTKTQARRVSWKPRVRLPRPVRSEDLIFLAGKGVHADPGIYPVELNPQGAVSATLPGGERLGLRPGEFDFVCPFANGPTALVNGRWTLAPQGQRLWVQEKHSLWQRPEAEPAPHRGVYYEAGIPRTGGGWRCVAAQMAGRWRSPAQMPRWAARLLLEVTAVRLERLQQISDADAQAEGARRTGEGVCAVCEVPCWTVDGEWHGPTATDAFGCAWSERFAKTFPWESNPWVWVVEFKRVRSVPGVIDRLCTCGRGSVAHTDACRAVDCTDGYPHCGDPCCMCERTDGLHSPPLKEAKSRQT